MKLSAIVAVSNNMAIGVDNDLPWHMPADLGHFKQSTMGCPVIMGRKTYDSIGRPLPGRKNVVLTRSENLSLDGCIIVNNLEEALLQVKDASEVFIIGGQQLYQQALPIAKRLYLTHINAQFEGDTFFPDYSHIEWKQVSLDGHAADEKNNWSYQFEVLERMDTFSD